MFALDDKSDRPIDHWRGLFRLGTKGEITRSRLAIAFRGFAVAVQRVAKTNAQMRGLVWSRGISVGILGCMGGVEMVGVVVVFIIA
jgi:hypothetical protein